ncbi:sulfurtransferase TusA family protein [Vibrio ponticus]|uniref:Sulfurtransferase TusA family protein n=1 Tax=Vibrio ponticus TaxID=265668 RepID=A0A3N3E5J1_9VIBR|nr:sulfurtransferase TusA family protein [Vibrio ponticus]ROV61993.1 sulfurtransferase TusA family protein [Vibrio ponticus]
MKDLDLRDQRCPMSLLLAKRRAVELEQGDTLTILIADPSSKSDIISFLQRNSFEVESTQNSNYYSLNVTRGKLPRC